MYFAGQGLDGSHIDTNERKADKRLMGQVFQHNIFQRYVPLKGNDWLTFLDLAEAETRRVNRH